MPEVLKSVLVPYSSDEMFLLVSDVESYPAFLPWCGGSSVQHLEDGSRLAAVQIAFKGLSQSFTTRNVHDHGQRIDMQLHDGPFKHLSGHWQFLPLSTDACKVSFELEYHFSSRLLEKLVGPVFEHITGSMVEAFVKRAEDLYGHRD